jgi:hypothetical protein
MVVGRIALKVESNRCFNNYCQPLNPINAIEYIDVSLLSPYQPFKLLMQCIRKVICSDSCVAQAIGFAVC